MPGYARLPSTPPPPTRAPFRWVTGWAIFAPWAMVAHKVGRKVGLPLPVALSGRSWLLFGHCHETGARAQGVGQQWPFLEVFAFDIGSGQPCALSGVRCLSWAQKS